MSESMTDFLKMSVDRMGELVEGELVVVRYPDDAEAQAVQACLEAVRTRCPKQHVIAVPESFEVARVTTPQLASAGLRVAAEPAPEPVALERMPPLPPREKMPPLLPRPPLSTGTAPSVPLVPPELREAFANRKVGPLTDEELKRMGLERIDPELVTYAENTL